MIQPRDLVSRRISNTATASPPAPHFLDPASSTPLILQLPEELLDAILTRVLEAAHDATSFQDALDPVRGYKGSEPVLGGPADLATAIRVCRAFHRIATPRLYETVFVYLPRQRQRVHRLLGLFAARPDIAGTCRRLFVTREKLYSDQDGTDPAGGLPWVALEGLPPADAPPPDPLDLEANRKVKGLARLLSERGVEIKARHGWWRDDCDLLMPQPSEERASNRSWWGL